MAVHELFYHCKMHYLANQLTFYFLYMYFGDRVDDLLGVYWKNRNVSFSGIANFIRNHAVISTFVHGVSNFWK